MMIMMMLVMTMMMMMMVMTMMVMVMVWAKSDYNNDDDIQATCLDARLSAEKQIVPISASTQDSDPQMEAATTTR